MSNKYKILKEYIETYITKDRIQKPLSNSEIERKEPKKAEYDRIRFDFIRESQRESKDELVRINSRILNEMQDINNRLELLTLSNRKFTLDLVIKIQNFINSIITEYPQILNIFLEEIDSSSLLMVIIVSDEIPFNEYSQLATFQIKLIKEFKDFNLDFKIMRTSQIKQIVQSSIMKIM
ncbi:MAG: hypothetical protein HZR80_16875 [Candidatus Heimdallarchaeota archaeon]